MGFVTAKGQRPMTQTRYHVLRHLERVQHHLALEVEDAAMDAFAAWAREANALVFRTDACVCAPDGAVLVDPATGDPEPGAEVPYPADAVERKDRTEALLGSLGVRVPKSLPPVVAEVEVELRAPREVASRCLALFACVLRAESLASKKEIPVSELRRRMPLAFDAMSPKERAFFGATPPADQDVVNHLWRYEALATLAWAVGLTGPLPSATTVCDVPALAKLMFAANDAAFLDRARLGATRYLLDALDLHFRLHWATTDARIKGAAPPAGLEPSVVLERHYALNWLTRFEDADWDDVETPT